MSKIARHYRENSEIFAPPVGSSWSESPRMLGAIVVGLYALIFLGFLNWQLSRQTQGNLEDQLARIENRLAQLSTKVDQVFARAAAPAQRGPDPNRVYTVNTDGAPFKGARNAPVTIAEFSDYQ